MIAPRTLRALSLTMVAVLAGESIARAQLAPPPQAPPIADLDDPGMLPPPPRVVADDEMPARAPARSPAPAPRPIAPPSPIAPPPNRPYPRYPSRPPAEATSPPVGGAYPRGAWRRETKPRDR